MKRLNRTLFDALPSNRMPERVLQFGTGGFLRGFVGHFINAANDQSLFNGRIVAVGSTGSGRDRVFNEQDGLFTLWVRGIEGGEPVSELRLTSAYSRALSATGQWPEVLECARSPELELIFSNTTEAGIALDERDAPDESPPRSFPAKLTRVLWERARHFEFDGTRGVVVVPCELIEDNGAKLKQLVLALAEKWQLDPRFARWIEEAVPFCNTLVDRIVPGEPAPASQEEVWHQLGYEDALLTVAEPYRLFAIEAGAQVAARLRFAPADPAVVITDDIAPYRLRKVRLLNGAHTIMVPLALLAGCATVSEAVDDPRVGAFLRHVLLQELVPSVTADGADAFARHVLERFANPFIRHELIDITLQHTMKMRVRVIPSIIEYTRTFGSAPSSIAFGFAAWLAYMREAREQRADAHADRVRAHWQGRGNARAVAYAVAGDEALWGMSLNTVPGFADAVADALHAIVDEGVNVALDAHLAAGRGRLNMRLAFRWFGADDPVTLSRIRQIPGVRGVVSALYDIPVGASWPLSRVLELKQTIEAAGLQLDVIESIPVHEDLKLGAAGRERLAEQYCASITALGAAGIPVLCYNFMPVFDWVRTELHKQLPDGSLALAYDDERAAAIDLSAGTGDLPGWAASYTGDELAKLVAAYRDVDEERLWDNLAWFIDQIAPVAEAANVKLAIHPDDPPWSVFGLPRILTGGDALRRFIRLHDSPAHGVTFCTGSLAPAGASELPALAAELARKGRIHFAHCRNVKITGPRDFHEVAHPGDFGDVDMVAVLRALHQNGFDGPLRPDHGRMIWDEEGRPGYGLYDRALGAAYLNGVWQALEANS